MFKNHRQRYPTAIQSHITRFYEDNDKCKLTYHTPAILTREGSKGVPLKGEPGASQAFLRISCALYKQKAYNSSGSHF